MNKTMPLTKLTRTQFRILLLIEEQGGEIQGSEKLSTALEANKTFILRLTEQLRDSGEITICKSCGGRGKKTVYKRNRNQAGLARKVKP
jgi:DNA-binding IscR family transcriptional regulator